MAFHPIEGLGAIVLTVGVVSTLIGALLCILWFHIEEKRWSEEQRKKEALNDE